MVIVMELPLFIHSYPLFLKPTPMHPGSTRGPIPSVISEVHRRPSCSLKVPLASPIHGLVHCH